MLKPTTPKSPKEIIKEKERKRLLEKQVREEVRDELEKELYGVQSDSRESIPRNVKKEVWNRDDRKCVKCGSQKNLEFDHIIPVSKGGSNTARNVQILCKKCNREKSNNIG
jgi:5-methylcytosine-specific restriction endonuclease McrA